MSQQYDNTNSGALFKNERKAQPSQPDYRGEVNVEGAEFWVSAWIKEGKKGKFMSLALTPKEEQKPAPKTHGQMRQEARGLKTGTGFDDMDDDIPF